MNNILFTQNHNDCWNRLMAHFDNASAVSGIMGYFQYKSGFDPFKGFGFGYNVKPSDSDYNMDMGWFTLDKTDYGIGAWHIWYDKQSWWNLAKKSGYALSSIESQLDFFLDELSGTTRKNLFDRLMLSENPEEAARIMYELYLDKDERDEKALDDIREYAHMFYKRFVHPMRKVRYIQITDEEVWVRPRPTFLSKHIYKVYKGEIYPFVVEIKKKWYCIDFYGKYKWIKAKCGAIIEREEAYAERRNDDGV